MVYTKYNPVYRKEESVNLELWVHIEEWQEIMRVTGFRSSVPTQALGNFADLFRFFLLEPVHASSMPAMSMKIYVFAV